MLETSGIRDAVFCARDMARDLRDASALGIVGHGVAQLFDGDGQCKLLVPFANLVTDVGDVYYAQKAIVGISPANATAPSAMTGMKLGTGTTAASKSGAGAALVTYKTGSNQAFDSAFPTAASKGAGAGARVQYKVSYVAGVATATGLSEVVIVNDAATNATTTAANTIARALLSPALDKGASDTLAITWNHDLLGA